MTRVLAIIAALVLIAIVFSPAMGYTIQIGAKSAFSIYPGAKVNFTIGNGTPAHEMAYQKEMAEHYQIYSINSTARPYSLQLGGKANYSIKAETNATRIVVLGRRKPAIIGTFGMIGKGLAVSIEPENATGQAIGSPTQTAKMPANEITNITKTAANVTKSSNVTNPTTATATIGEAATAVVKLSIMGKVKDINETGLAGWMINIEGPAKAIISSTTTSENGSYSFSDLVPGDYFMAETLPADWTVVSPAYGKTIVSLKDKSVTGIDFVNKKAVPTTSKNVTAMVKNATTAAYWLTKAQALEDHGNYSESLEAYDKALELDPNYREALMAKARILGKLGNHNESLKAYDAVINLDPKYAEAWIAKANAFKLLGRDLEADEAMAKASELAAVGKPVIAKKATSETKNATKEAKNVTSPAETNKPAPNETKDTIIKVLGLDSTSFPQIKVTPFVNTTCAKIGGLNKEDFKVKENDEDVKISSFYFSGNASGQSVDLAVVFDDTGSMQPQIDAMKSKVEGLIKQINISGLNTRYSLVTFKDKVSVRRNWTNNQDSIYQSINALLADGGIDEPEDSLDAIETVLSMGFRPNAQKIILVITDAHAHYKGDGTTYSKYTKDEVKRDLENSGAVFMPISPKFRTSTGFADLRDISNETQSMWIDIRSAEFSTILDNFKQILTGTYVLEYTSTNLAPNRNRTITVTIDKPECAVGSASALYTSPEKR